MPSLVVHGELSDVLSAESVAKMTAELPDMTKVTVPRVGHAPTLDEPEAQAAIDALLKRVAGGKAQPKSGGTRKKSV
jgi:pimeloyl-ACP methyl ester carboxylesterase